VGCADDRVEDVGVLLHAQGLHQDDEGDLSAGHGNGDYQDAVLLLLEGRERPVALLLREDARDRRELVVPLCVLYEDPVRREVLDGYQDALRSVDDEVAARVEGVCEVLRQLALVVLGRDDPRVLEVVGVQVALLGLAHDGQVADPDRFRLALDAVVDDGDLQVDRRFVGEVPEGRLHGRELVGGAVGLLDLGLADGDLSQFDYELLVGDLEADQSALSLLTHPHAVDDALHPAVLVVHRRQERVERRDVMVDDAPVLEEGLDKFSHYLTSPLRACRSRAYRP